MTVASRLSKWSFYLIFFPAVLGIVGWQGWSWWSWAKAPVQLPGSNLEEATIQVQIPLGTSIEQIGRDLEAIGVIRSASAWNLWARWLRLRARMAPETRGEFQAGTYALSQAESLSEIASKIWAGEVVQLSYTIPEGWSLKQMAEYFEARGFFSAEAFLAATRQIPDDDFVWLPPNLPHLEGFLYPDTYQLADGVLTPELVIRQMLYQFEQVALPVYEQRQGQTNLSLLEWVTLGSIVEKESVVAEERGLIAGVFTQRLQRGMRLEADPTVEYGLGIRQTQEQPLTLRQVQTPSEYNTYLNAGLPPTPIASPGVASLEATLNPAATDYLFFMARYDGTHIFSRTLEEHNRAIAQVERELSNRQPQAGNELTTE
ncbi:endolytic transglycosylase MltG [Kamptonema cortianum]|uniref:Endolytic murein transglycosylase n=1 Tax=Geitlerinema calcuttense NRMC-F 0142 TaxID=2922238 RepID=A0ABT7LW66_9CYAN|nr:endolytic transglycosylase MltG [Geitlerinema calcuttense]MCD8487406.1 endolytic transglycosylase MltG [Desertifilum sp.]MDK3159175.1 endolytic transglycosylase MltG [Kamptonema cortianum]MDL5056278.1 endolytic transglycosylase MltG [Geitlerinema calcuttense NRMC-F 0142]